LREIAVDQAKKAILAKRELFENKINQELQEQHDRLNKLKVEHEQQLESKFQFTSELIKEKKNREKRYLERIFEDYWRWR